ncbi:MAG: hypothetical protein K2P69_05815, partial [Eubacterium sp.]|nr:hypothetical protein [Eubacterium sp.]
SLQTLPLLACQKSFFEKTQTSPPSFLISCRLFATDLLVRSVVFLNYRSLILETLIYYKSFPVFTEAFSFYINSKRKTPKQYFFRRFSYKIFLTAC